MKGSDLPDIEREVISCIKWIIALALIFGLGSGIGLIYLIVKLLE